MDNGMVGHVQYATVMMENAGETGEWLQRLWARQRTAGLSDFAGLQINAQVPITQAVLDDLMRPLPLPDAIRDFRLRFGGNDLLTLDTTVSTFLFTRTIRLDARVDRSIPFPQEPVLLLTLLTGGLIELILNVVTLPDFVRIEGRQIRIDLGMLLRRSDQEWLTPLLYNVTVNVRSGVAYLEAHLIVPEPTQTRKNVD